MLTRWVVTYRSFGKILKKGLVAYPETSTIKHLTTTRNVSKKVRATIVLSQNPQTLCFFVR